VQTNVAQYHQNLAGLIAGHPPHFVKRLFDILNFYRMSWNASCWRPRNPVLFTSKKIFPSEENLKEAW